jgi:hypothetical protein
VGERHFGEIFYSLVVIHDALLDNAAVPVARVLAHADVRNDYESLCLLFQLPYGLLNNAVRVVALRASLVFLFGYPEEEY